LFLDEGVDVLLGGFHAPKSANYFINLKTKVSG
jgi:hypothetical protein